MQGDTYEIAEIERDKLQYFEKLRLDNRDKIDAYQEMAATAWKKEERKQQLVDDAILFADTSQFTVGQLAYHKMKRDVIDRLELELNLFN